MYYKRPIVKLNVEYATSVGERLRSAREARGSSRSEIADDLLFSVTQIESLESCSLAKFYGPTLFSQAIIKYATFLDVNVDRIKLLEVVSVDRNLTNMKQQESMAAIAAEDAPASIIDRGFRMIVASPFATTWPPLKSVSGRFLYLATVMAVVPLVLIVQPSLAPVEKLLAFGEEFLAPQITVASVPAITSNAAPEAEAEETDAMAMPATLQSFAVLETNGTCWIQLMYADGRKEQQVYPPNTKLEFKSGELAGLIIGDLDVTLMSVNGKKVDLNQYRKPETNVARLLGKNGAIVLGMR